MEFHHKKLVKPAYRPRPFSYAVRRPDHDPEGVLAIEAERGRHVVARSRGEQDPGVDTPLAADLSHRLGRLGHPRHLERTAEGQLEQVGAVGAGRDPSVAPGTRRRAPLTRRPSLFVAPEHERKGVGKALHETMLTWYWQRAATLRLSTAPGTRAELFYRKAGYLSLIHI